MVASGERLTWVTGRRPEPVMAQYTIYRNAPGGGGSDWPFALRRVLIYRGMPPQVGLAWGARTVEEARGMVPAEADLCMARCASDDPSIVETWM